MTDDCEFPFREQVKVYCEKYRHPDLPLFVICKTHTMTSWHNTPEASRPGCYVYYSEDGRILYIGKASMTRDVGNRLAAHDYQNPQALWRQKAKFVQIVSVPEPFEAPSLEEFLLNKLRPEGNIRKGMLVSD